MSFNEHYSRLSRRSFHASRPSNFRFDLNANTSVLDTFLHVHRIRDYVPQFSAILLRRKVANEQLRFCDSLYQRVDVLTYARNHFRDIVTSVRDN